MASDGVRVAEEEESLDEWQHIESLNPHFTSATSPLHSPPTDPTPARQRHAKDVVTSDDYRRLSEGRHRSSSVFLPTHHEDLDVIVPQPAPPSPLQGGQKHLYWQSQPPSPSSASSSSSSSVAGDEEAKVTAISGSSGVVGRLARVRNCLVFRGSVRSFGLARSGGVAAALVLLSAVAIYVRRRWSWRWRWTWTWTWTGKFQEASQSPLVLLIKDKDRKINELLIQIAEMNELISARRRVQVLRVA